MSDFERIKYGECPNGHGDMVFFNHPIDLATIIPDDEIDIGGFESGDLGYIVAVCQECGFVLSLNNIDNHDEYLEWLKTYREGKR